MEIKANYTVDVSTDSVKEKSMSAKEKVAELINQIGNSLDAPEYAGKVLTECGKEILKIAEELSAKAPHVWLVLQCTDQRVYSEGRYFTTAEDATEVLAVYDNEDTAQDIVVKLEREEAERQGRDDYDIECDGRFYYKVLPMEVHREPRWSELPINMAYDNIRDDR